MNTIRNQSKLTIRNQSKLKRTRLETSQNLKEHD